MKHFLKGILNISIIIVLSPLIIIIGLSLMLIDLIFIAGGRDPFNTPIRKIINKIRK